MQKQTNIRAVFHLDRLGFNRCLDFGYYHYNNAAPSLDNHRHHKALEICYYLKGQQHYKLGDDLFKLTGNDIFIVPQDIDHSSGVYPEEIGELFWLQVSFQKSKGNLCNLSEAHTDYLLTELEKRAGVVHKGSFSLKPILRSILKKLKEPKSIIKEMFLNQLIVRLLLETFLITKEPQYIINSEKLSKIEEFIEKNLDRTVYVDELANLINVSTVYFKSWFKKKMGVPPKTYINRLKIEQAKTDLLKKRTITQTAFELGFSSSQYFSTVFKKHTGVTPRDFLTLRKERVIV